MTFPDRIIVDPIDDNYAIDSERPEKRLSALRFLPHVQLDGRAPTVAELENSIIVGYCAPEDIRYTSGPDDTG